MLTCDAYLQLREGLDPELVDVGRIRYLRKVQLVRAEHAGEIEFINIVAQLSCIAPPSTRGGRVLLQNGHNRKLTSEMTAGFFQINCILYCATRGNIL